MTRINDELWEFINRCWAEPARRPNIGEVSAFIQQYRARCENESNATKSGDDPSGSSNLKEAKLDDVCRISCYQLYMDDNGFTGLSERLCCSYPSYQPGNTDV
jgi:hypothetical protein